MTYLELLLKIKDGTQPKAVRVDGTTFHWLDGYVSSDTNAIYEHIYDGMDDKDLAVLDFIEIVE